MEDEGFIDDDFIEEGAQEYVARHGEEAPALLRQRADIAAAAGAALLAQAWRDMAEAAEAMLAIGDVPGFF